MKRRADETPEENLEPETGENSTLETAGEPKKTRSKYSVTLYVVIMFVVVILLILLSYFIQQRNSKTIQDLTTQHSEFSIEALQNIEDLQDKSIELMEQVDDLKKQLADTKEEWAEDVKQVEDRLKEDYNETLLEYQALCSLLDMEIAIENGDMSLAKEKAKLIEAAKDTLDENYLARYENLAKKIK